MHDELKGTDQQKGGSFSRRSTAGAFGTASEVVALHGRKFVEKWWPEMGSESLWSFGICNLHILHSEESGESARMSQCAFNLLANFERPIKSR